MQKGNTSTKIITVSVYSLHASRQAVSFCFSIVHTIIRRIVHGYLVKFRLCKCSYLLTVGNILRLQRAHGLCRTIIYRSTKHKDQSGNVHDMAARTNLHFHYHDTAASHHIRQVFHRGVRAGREPVQCVRCVMCPRRRVMKDSGNWRTCRNGLYTFAVGLGVLLEEKRETRRREPRIPSMLRNSTGT